MKADRVAVVDDGKIIELGTHEELVELGGRYSEMFRTWTSHVESDAAVEATPLSD
jgi:ABC-type multidrug transport system fused ATPase/permease subunit